MDRGAQWDKLRREVYARDKYTCQWCGAKGKVHAEHIIQKSEGGSDHLSNLQTLCGLCHALKHGWRGNTFWLLLSGLRQLGFEIGERDRDSGDWSFRLDNIEGSHLRMRNVELNIRGFEATVPLPIARHDEHGKELSSVPDGFYEALLPIFELHCVKPAGVS